MDSTVKKLKNWQQIKQDGVNVGTAQGTHHHVEWTKVSMSEIRYVWVQPPESLLSLLVQLDFPVVGLLMMVVLVQGVYCCSMLCACREAARRHLTVTWAQEWQSNVLRNCWNRSKHLRQQKVCICIDAVLIHALFIGLYILWAVKNEVEVVSNSGFFLSYFSMQ